MDKWPKVSIIILNWNNYEDTRECLGSLEKITYPNYDVIVVDNGSTDGSGERLSQEFSKYEFVFNQKNLGYAAGNNIGIKEAIERGAKYIYILNNDTVIKKNPIFPSIVTMEEDPQIGISGGTLYYYHKPDLIQNTGSYISFYTGKVYTIGDGEVDNGTLQFIQECKDVDFICGAAIMIRRDVFNKIGMFDENFFLFGEDADLCFRAREQGFKVKHVPKSEVLHKGGATIEKIKSKQLFYGVRNKIWLIFRHGELKEKIGFIFLLFFYLLPKMFVGRIIKNGIYLLKPLIQGTFAGLFKLPEPPKGVDN